MSTFKLSSIVDYHQMLYSNLKLFCQIFPNCDMAKSSLDVDVFKKPNSKMMHSIFYSVISIMSLEKCRSLLPWPAVYKADTYKFKSGIFKFIEEEFTDFNSPKIAYSLINAASGDKFVQFLCRFCLHATKFIIKKYYGYDVLERVPHLTDENKRLIQELICHFETEYKCNQDEFDKILTAYEENVQSMLEELRIAEKQVVDQMNILAERVQNISDTTSCNKTLLMDMDSENAISEWFENIRCLQAEMDKQMMHVTKDIDLVDKLENFTRMLNDLLKVHSEGFDIDVDDISDYVMNLAGVQPENITDQLCTDKKLSLEKLLAFGFAVERKYIENCARLEPPQKYHDMIKVLKDKIADAKEDMERVAEVNDKIECNIRVTGESIAYLRNQMINNLDASDVRLYSTIISTGPDISFPLNNNYAKSIPDVTGFYNTGENISSLTKL